MSSTDSVGASAPFAKAVDESESDHDTSYQPVQPATPRSRSAARANTTPPQNILTQGGTASDAAKTQPTQHSHHGKLCSVTFSVRSLECAHILRRATRGWEVTTLEYAWGVKLGTLNLDNTQNRMWLSPHLHSYFDSGDWALLPPKDVLEDIQDTSVNELTFANKTKFTAVCRRSVRKYDFVHFIETTEPILRPDEPGSVNYTMHSSPFPNLSPVLSHVNPYFVICNVALKDEKHHPQLLGRIPGPGYATLTAEQLGRVRLCRTIYALWMGQATAAAAAAKALSAGKSQSNHTSAHSSTSRRSNPERQAKRKRNDGQDNPGPTGTGGSPTRRGGVTSSALGDLPRTPEEFVNVDELDLRVNDFDSMEQPYWSKVEGWITNLASAECPGMKLK